MNIQEYTTYYIKKGNEVDIELKKQSTRKFILSCIHWESNIIFEWQLAYAEDPVSNEFKPNLVPVYIDGAVKTVYLTIADAIMLINKRFADEGCPFRIQQIEERPQYANSTVVFRIKNKSPMTYEEFINYYNKYMGDFYEDQTDITVERVV